MGYTHYYYTKQTLNPDKFLSVVNDFKRMLTVFEDMKIKLAGGDGTGNPTITKSKIVFNGKTNCGHKEQDLGITWPSDTAKGVSDGQTGKADGSWFAGATLSERMCGGDCSHVTFALEQSHKPDTKYDQHDKTGKVFNCTKTAYKPYDLAVNVALIIAKHHLKDELSVHSDGEIKDWQDGMQLCKQYLGYGSDFKLDEDDEE